MPGSELPAPHQLLDWQVSCYAGAGAAMACTEPPGQAALVASHRGGRWRSQNSKTSVTQRSTVASPFAESTQHPLLRGQRVLIMRRDSQSQLFGHRVHGSSEVLRNRLPYVLDVTGEDFRASRGSLPLELLRAGFVEWAGAKARSDAATRHGLAALDEGLRYMPVVLCSEPKALFGALSGDLNSGLLAVGQQAGNRRVDPGSMVQWPFELPGNIDTAAVAWFGAPERTAKGEDYWHLPLARDRRSLSADTIQAHLREVELLWFRRSVSHGFVLLNLDGMTSLTERRDGVADEVYAAVLAWAQRGSHDVTVIVYGVGVAPAIAQQAMGHVARHLGRALFRATAV